MWCSADAARSAQNWQSGWLPESGAAAVYTKEFDADDLTSHGRPLPVLDVDLVDATWSEYPDARWGTNRLSRANLHHPILKPHQDDGPRSRSKAKSSASIHLNTQSRALEGILQTRSLWATDTAFLNDWQDKKSTMQLSR